MKDLIERSYQSIVNRGLISKETTRSDFNLKMREELLELSCAECEDDYIEEVTDLMTVCINQLVHIGRDPIKEFEKVVLKNESRI